MTHRLFFASLLGSLLTFAGAITAADKVDTKLLEVPVARAVVREVTDYEDFVGRTEASQSVNLRSRVSGYVLKASFQEGATVKKGDLLFEIDPRPYQAQLDKVEAALKLAEAQLRLAEAKLKRSKRLLDQNAIGREEYDVIVAEREQAHAKVLAEKAARAFYQLNLDCTRIHAPIDGRIGRRLVDPDNLVKADETTLAVINRSDPAYVLFDVDERSYLRLRESLPEGRGKEDKLPVAVARGEEEGFSHRGTVDFTDNQLNADTGTVRMRAVLPNKDGALIPGLFVRIRLTIGAPHKVMLVPEAAVLVEEGTKYVYVVNDKDAIERRELVLGRTHDGQRAVTRGLKAEERVVIGRQQRLRPGMTVKPSEQKPAPKRGKSSESGGEPPAPSVRGQARRGILVETVYPGASATVVSESVREPIEQQVSGMEKLRFLRSRCASDGKYALALTFAPGVDLTMAQVLVQNRVNLAQPLLPTEVLNQAITVCGGTAGVLMIVNLSSPDSDYDQLYLSNYATVQIKDELSRLPGVGEVSLLGQSDYCSRIWLDTDKLAARNLSIAQVVRTLKDRKLRGNTADEFMNPILKGNGEGQLIRLKDVANVEIGVNRGRSTTTYNGKPVAALLVHLTGGASPRKVRTAVRETLKQLRARLPKGLELTIAFDFTDNLASPDRPASEECLLLDLHLPNASAERILRIQQRCEALLRQIAGVQDVLAMSANPFDLFSSSPCILVRLTPANKRKALREEIAQTIRARLDEIKVMTLGLRDLSRPDCFPRCGYPIDLAIRGSKAADVREFAKEFAARLRDGKHFTDTWANTDSEPRLLRSFDVDRVAAMKRGVSLEDVFAVLQTYHGSLYVNDFQRFGRTWRVEVQAQSPRLGEGANGLRKLQVRNARGQMIPLNTIVKMVETEAPTTLDFLDLWPMVEITANPNAGVKLELARKLCETLAEEVRKELHLPAEYRLVWLP